jgi:hypothetical protein
MDGWRRLKITQGDTGTIPPPTIRRRRIQTRLRRNTRPPRAKANADRVTVLDDRQHWRPPSINLARHPTLKVVLEQSFIFNDDHIGGLRKRIRKLECWPVGLTALGCGHLA